jgi:hypothetical protein
VADACHAEGLRFGIYLSAYDKHYCDAEKVNYPTYTQYYTTQLRELLTNYGTVDEVWFDGNGAANMVIDWDSVYQIILTLQPTAVSFLGFWITDYAGIRVEWPGNEDGINYDTCWNLNPLPDSNLVWTWGEWHPYEADVKMQGDWFWYNNPSVAPLDTFKRVYLTSVGRGAVALMNIPPNPSGVIDTEAFPTLRSFKAWVDSIYSMNLAPGKTATASSVRGNDPAFGADKAIDTFYDSYWAPESTDAAPSLEVDLGAMDTIRMFIVQEYIPLGQRVASHTIQTWDGSQWTSVGNAATHTTRWCACNGNTGHWWMVNLGSSYNLAGSEVMWELPEHVYKYKIETSPDNVTWSLSVDKTANTIASQTQSDNFTTHNVRYVRITITGLDTNCWASFYDFKVYCQDSGRTDIALNKPATDDCEQSWHPASNGNDFDYVATGSTIGYKRIHSLPSPVVASKARLIINRCRSVSYDSISRVCHQTFPLINNFGIIGKAGPSAIKWTGPSVTNQTRLEILAIRHGHLHLRLPEAESISIELVRIDGKTIKRQRFFTRAGVVDFSIPPHASGVYILKVSIAGKEGTNTTVFLQ